MSALLDPALRHPDRLAKIETLLTTALQAMQDAEKLEQAARNLLATLTPEGEVERLAAKKLAELLRPEVANHG